MKRAIFNWSGGKDSSLALYQVLQRNDVEIVGLLSTFNKEADRLSMHGVRRQLLQQQAANIGLPLFELSLPEDLTMETYDETMKVYLEQLIGSQDIEYSIFGDIFLEDLRKYREEQLSKIGLNAMFPLWKQSTQALAREFIELGFKAKLVCVSSPLLDERFVGREFDYELLKDLPDGIDPCGENGEFHTFVYDGPIFKEPISVRTGEKIYKPIQQDYAAGSEKKDQVNGFWYCDLV